MRSILNTYKCHAFWVQENINFFYCQKKKKTVRWRNTLQKSYAIKVVGDRSIMNCKLDFADHKLSYMYDNNFHFLK